MFRMVAYSRRLQSGQITCYLNRTYHVLLTPRTPDSCVKPNSVISSPPEVVMCSNNVGVAKRLDLESISEDIANLVKQLDKEVEGEVQVRDLKNVSTKIEKIIKG